MMQLADFIVGYIHQNMRVSSEKSIIRVDGFEDLRLYLRICERMDELCASQGNTLIAKLSRSKFAQMEETGQWPSEAAIMRQRGWVDEEDHMTSYRNQLPESGKKLVVLLLGTDMVDDKGGLNDFFAVTPNRIDSEIGDQYARLISPKLLDAFDNPDLLCDVVNRFFKDLFSCVPRNLSKVSSILDSWQAEAHTVEEAMIDLFQRLPEWGIPMVQDAVKNLRPAKFVASKEKDSLVRQASEFIKGRTYSRVTQSTIKKVQKLFQQYQNGEAPGKYALEYPAHQALASIADLESAVISFIIGDRNTALRNQLINTDFSIIVDVLNKKIREAPKTTLTPTKVTGSPLVMLMKVFLSILQEYHSEIDTLRICWLQARLCGIPSNVEVADQDEKDALLLETWSSISRFAGGVDNFINEEDWQGSEEQSVSLVMKPSDFLVPAAGPKLIEDGIVSSGSGTTHKISFRAEALSGEEIIYHEDFVWVIDPNEDWMLAFQDFPNMPEEQTCYIPFGVIQDINTAFTQKDEDSFAFWITHASVQLDNGSLWANLDRELIESGSSEEGAKFHKLGRSFQSFRRQVMNQGFFVSLNDTASALQSEYITLAKRVCETPIYVGKLHTLVGRMTFFFTLCENMEPVMGSCAAAQVIVPPWHPATLEKLADQMLFIRSGMHEWSQTSLQEDQGPDRRLSEIMSLSAIRTATDGFFKTGSNQMTSRKSFGYYTLYGDVLDTETFVSAQQIERKETVFDDDFNDRDMRRMTRESDVLLQIIRRYVDTYPQAKRSLSLAFINPEDLQNVVSALYQYVTELRKDDPGCQLSLRLTVINRTSTQGSRAYLAYWINHVFTLDDSLDVKAYIQVYDQESEIPKLISSITDIAFFFDALDTNQNASYQFRPCSTAERMSDCRFPMVFKPALKTRYGLQHSIDITQPQFRVATAHTQLLRVYNDQHQYGFQSALVQSSSADRRRGAIIERVQDRTVWLCCIDNAMDKYTVRKLYADQTGIIGFTTGEGSYGQMNLALTCRSGIISDLRLRCKRRLHMMFPSWSDQQLHNAADFCLKKAGELDGASILRAMNPNDFDMNNFLAYLIADELTEKKRNCLCILIRLDSYRHWFHSERKGETKIPDFLLLQADVVPGGQLHINATIIEAKIAGGVSMLTEHLPKANEQVTQGIAVLSRQFDPDSHSVERRYWLAQLYRAIAFLQADADFDDAYFNALTEQLNEMIEGNYTISWSGRILGCEIDGNFSIIKGNAPSDDILYEYWRIGQLGIQNVLQGKPLDAEASFDGSATMEETVISDVEEEEIPIVEVNPRDTIIVPEPSGGTPVTNQVSTSEPGEQHIEPACVINPPETNVGVTQNEETPNLASAVADTASESADDQPASTTTALEQIRVLIGKDRGQRPVCWEFGHPQLANRHLLITGGSGQGKTYAIQTFLYELARQNISSVVFDYTDGFLPGKLEPPFEQALEGRIEQHYAIAGGLPINPFKRQPLHIPGLPEGMLEKSTSVASRFSAIMKHVYSFGEQQAAALYQACKDGIDHFGDQMDFEKLRQLLSAQESSFSKTVLSKMQQLFDLDLFDTASAFDWSRITERDGRVTIIQLTNLDREIQTVITEMLMWDAWYSLVKFGDKSRPFVVVLDEAQNLSFVDGSPAQKILQEGRKYGWSAWFATQFMKGALSSDEISRLQQAAETLYFKPSAEETSSVASMLSDGNTTTAEWTEVLKQMQKGHCIVRGDRIRPNNTFGAAPAALVKVSSFEERN